MKRLTARCGLALIALLGLVSPPLRAAELHDSLAAFSPLLDQEWRGGYVGADAPDIEIVLRFEPILGGTAVRYTRQAEAADFTAVTHFYVLPDVGEVRYVSLNNRGLVEEGAVTFEDGGIVLLGTTHWPDRTVETRTSLARLDSGALRDTFMRRENDAWVPGHVQEFVVEESP